MDRNVKVKVAQNLAFGFNRMLQSKEPLTMDEAFGPLLKYGRLRKATLRSMLNAMAEHKILDLSEGRYEVVNRDYIRELTGHALRGNHGVVMQSVNKLMRETAEIKKTTQEEEDEESEREEDEDEDEDEDEEEDEGEDEIPDVPEEEDVEDMGAIIENMLDGRESYRLMQAMAGMEVLEDGKWHKRVELFGLDETDARWSRQLLQQLHALGHVERKGERDQSRYRLVNNVSQDTVEIASALWPSRRWMFKNASGVAAAPEVREEDVTRKPDDGGGEGGAQDSTLEKIVAIMEYQAAETTRLNKKMDAILTALGVPIPED